MLGDGAMVLTIDPSGRVEGSTSDGPLGTSLTSGKSANGLLAGTLRRKDAKDDGLTGTVMATLDGPALTGTMNLADGNAAVVRVATFRATKK